MKVAIERIEKELEERLKELKAENKLLEAQRLEQRTNYDLEMMRDGLLFRNRELFCSFNIKTTWFHTLYFT